MKALRLACLLVSLLGTISVAVADGNDVRGTQQVKGFEGHFGQTYTLKSGFNYTLLSAAYSIERINTDEVTCPTGDEKLLVLRFKIKNSGTDDAYYDTSAHTFTAVDAGGEDHPGGGSVGRLSTGKGMVTTLKPGQGYEDLYTCIRVPGKGAIPKIIFNQGRMGTEEDVIRFTLATASIAANAKPNPAKNEVSPLPDYARDPADSSGASTLPVLPAKLATYYPLASLDVKLESVSYTANKIVDAEPEEGKQYLVALLTLKNRTNAPVTVYGGMFDAKVKDAENNDYEAVQALLKAKRDEDAGKALDPGEELQVRFVYALPKDMKAKTLNFKEGDSHTYAFDIAMPQ